MVKDKNKYYKFYNLYNEHKWLLFLLLVSLIPLRDLFHPGLFVAHDSQDHVARIANFYQNLVEGNLIPRWAGNLNWGYGHPILMFLYPLPSYVASLFHFLGLSLVVSVKIVFGLGFTLSGVTMYLWIKEMWGRKAGFSAGLLYMFASYRFVDLYVRGAMGENFFFIWPPLICYFLLKLSRDIKTSTTILQSMGNNWKCLFGGSLSIAAMILSHNALSLMFLPFIGVYGLWVLSNGKRKMVQWFNGSMVILLGFGLSAFFWMPAFFEGKYTLRDIVTKGEYTNNFEIFSRLIYSSWSYGGTGQFSVQLGILQWMVILLIPLIAYLKWKKTKLKTQMSNVKTTAQNLKLLIFSYFIFWIAIFLMLSISQPIYEKVSILQKFQFPWRWLSLAILPPAIVAGLVVGNLAKKFGFLSVICFLLFALWFNKDFWHAKEYSFRPASFYTGVYPGTTDTGESAPVWSVRFMEKEPKAFLEIVEGEGEAATIERKTTLHRYKVNVKSEKARILDNTLYFPGWFVYVAGVKKEVNDIWFQDPNYRGLINFFVNRGEHVTEIKFEETRLRKTADIISAASMFGLLFIGFITCLPKLKIKS